MSICCPFTASLPVEIMFNIFVYVGEHDLENVAATCRLMNKFVSYNEVWRQLFQVYFPELKMPSTILNWRSELIWAKGAERRKARYSFNQMYGLCGRIPQKPVSFPEAPFYFHKYISD
jgi:hypothetical protein